MCISHKNKINKPQIKWKMFYGFDLFSRSLFTAHPFSGKYLFLYSVLWRVRLKREITRLSQIHHADTECLDSYYLAAIRSTAMHIWWCRIHSPRIHRAKKEEGKCQNRVSMHGQRAIASIHLCHIYTNSPNSTHNC